MGGMFVGAVAMEVARRKCPERVDKLYDKVKCIGTSMKDAFCEGYNKAGKPAEEPVAEAQA